MNWTPNLVTLLFPKVDQLQSSVDKLEQRFTRRDKDIALFQVTLDDVKNSVYGRPRTTYDENFQFNMLDSVKELVEFDGMLAERAYFESVLRWANNRITTQESNARLFEAKGLIFSRQLQPQCSLAGTGKKQKHPLRERRKVVKFFQALCSNRYVYVNEALVAKFLKYKL